MTAKPLGRKAYGSIPHLPGSRRGPGDHGIENGAARILTEKARDKNDLIVVTEKLDGTNVAVAKIGGAILTLGRSGHPALSSPWEHVRLFNRWATAPEQYGRFDQLLEDGEWVSGEWLALAHGTRYELGDLPPFAAFDLFRDGERIPLGELVARCLVAGIETVPILHTGGPVPIEQAIELLDGQGYYGAIDAPEGAVWRVERNRRFDFMAKYVRPEKVDGCYLPEVSGQPGIWHWRI